MLRERTVFVIGAGASAEFGLPVGSGLARSIKGKMDIRFERFNEHIGSGDIDLFMALTNSMRDRSDELQKAAWQIRDGIDFSSSIDDFLESHQTNKLVNLYGKSAIVKSILEAERNSKLFIDNRSDQNNIDVNKLEDTWIVKVLRLLTRGITLANVDKIFDNVSFIVFNYDRCVEHFLFHLLQRMYSLDRYKASEVLQKVNIIHPFGRIERVDFGAARADIVGLANSIKTYTDQIDDAALMESTRAEMRLASKIVFLGFGYHKQNMEIINPKEKLNPKLVIGTGLGLSQANVSAVRLDIGNMITAGDNNTAAGNISNASCAELINEYYMSL